MYSMSSVLLLDIIVWIQRLLLFKIVNNPEYTEKMMWYVHTVHYMFAVFHQSRNCIHLSQSRRSQSSGWRRCTDIGGLVPVLCAHLRQLWCVITKTTHFLWIAITLHNLFMSCMSHKTRPKNRIFWNVVKCLKVKKESKQCRITALF